MLRAGKEEERLRYARDQNPKMKAFEGKKAAGEGGGKQSSKTEQAASPLPNRIHNQSAHEQPHRDPDGDLNHTIRDVQDIAIDIEGGRSAG